MSYVGSQPEEKRFPFQAPSVYSYNDDFSKTCRARSLLEKTSVPVCVRRSKVIAFVLAFCYSANRSNHVTN